MILLNDSSKTVFVSVYSGLQSFDSLPPVGCFSKGSLKLGSKCTTGIFLDCLIYGIYGVCDTEFNTHLNCEGIFI
jgi:hypothetical protein